MTRKLKNPAAVPNGSVVKKNKSSTAATPNAEGNRAERRAAKKASGKK